MKGIANTTPLTFNYSMIHRNEPKNFGDEICRWPGLLIKPSFRVV